MEHERKRRWWIYIVVLMVLYPLSVGPFVWVVRRDESIDLDTAIVVFETLYWPIEWLANNSDPFDRVLNWYIDLWIEEVI